jgi:class 3 adenylate cyclase
VLAGGREVQRFALSALRTITPITGFSYADPEGNFLYVLRNDKGGFDTKSIDRRDGGHTVTWTRRDAQGNVTAIDNDPSDNYDPHARPWYEGAESTKKPFWTDTYLFFTLKKPGITFSIPHFDAEGKLVTVMGVDIELASLCAFLHKLDIGLSGRAIIVDQTGRVVAYPSDNWLPADKPDAKAPMLDELGDPVLTRAYNRLRVQGYGRQVLDVEDHRIIVSSAPVSMIAGRDWVVLIVVPETDFVGFVSDSAFAALVMSVLVVLIVAGLSSLLAWRNMTAERRVADAAARHQALEVRTRTFVELARNNAPADAAEDEALETALEAAAADCAAKRVTVWRLNPDRTTLLCEDCFDQVAHDHTSGMELHRDQVPDLFAALGNGMPIDAVDASQGRTEDLYRTYLKPLHISSVYIVPIMGNGRLMGMLMVEDPQRGAHTASMVAFCDALSVVLALRYAAAAPPVPVAQRAAVAAASTGAGGSGGEIETFAERQSRLERTLMQQNVTLEDLEESAIDRAAIAVLKLPAWTTVAQRPAGCEERTAMDAIVDELRRTIEKSGVSYAALLDDQIVLAAFSGDKTAVAASARCVATTVLDLRDRLLELEERWNTSLDFCVAIDIGMVMSSTVGTEPPSRHLWGGAVGIAKVLAGTTARRTIAASETAYEILADRFLFRPRGTYFLPETGDMRTFVMVGRI